MRGYEPAVVVGISGAALLLFGVLASTDGSTVGGIVLGAMAFGAGAMLALDIAKARRNVRANEPPAIDILDDRTLRAIQARQDRSGQTRAARRVDE